MDIHSHLLHLKELDLPPREFVIVSSGALAIRGIREAKDLDVIVSDQAWDDLKERYPVTLNESNVERIVLDHDIEILNPRQSLFGNGKIVPLSEIFEKADSFDGIQFINLDHLKKIKTALGRQKDLNDIALIDNYLSTH